MDTREAQAAPDPPDDESPDVLYWFGEFARFGMCSPQAERLAAQPGLDRHSVRAALEHGCDPDVAFLIYS